MSRTPTIFVNIPAYRDSEIYPTLNDLFNRARYPERIHIGLCWQYDCLREEPFRLRDRNHQISLIQIDYKRARGCSWARSKIQSLYGGEDYFLHIDAHTRFIPHWDEVMIEELARCPSQKPLLTTYPNHYTLPNTLADHGPYKLTYNTSYNRVPSFHSRPCTEEERAAPSLSIAASGGFVFGHGSTIREVPHDPYIYFVGEEVVMSVRYWTHGYDMFTPTRTMLFHLYGEAAGDKNLHWKDHTDWHDNCERLSRMRVLHLLNIENTADEEALREIGRYDMGRARSLADYQRFAGVDFAREHYSDAAKKGLPSL